MAVQEMGECGHFIIKCSSCGSYTIHCNCVPSEDKPLIPKGVFKGLCAKCTANTGDTQPTVHNSAMVPLLCDRSDYCAYNEIRCKFCSHNYTSQFAKQQLQ